MGWPCLDAALAAPPPAAHVRQGAVCKNFPDYNPETPGPEIGCEHIKEMDPRSISSLQEEKTLGSRISVWMIHCTTRKFFVDTGQVYSDSGCSSLFRKIA